MQGPKYQHKKSISCPATLKMKIHFTINRLPATERSKQKWSFITGLTFFFENSGYFIVYRQRSVGVGAAERGQGTSAIFPTTEPTSCRCPCIPGHPAAGLSLFRGNAIASTLLTLVPGNKPHVFLSYFSFVKGLQYFFHSPSIILDFSLFFKLPHHPPCHQRELGSPRGAPSSEEQQKQVVTATTVSVSSLHPLTAMDCVLTTFVSLRQCYQN